MLKFYYGKVMWLDMAIAKSEQEIKREAKREKRNVIDKLTNRYMINLCWGILGIVLLRFVESGYSSSDTILIMPVIMKSLAGAFAVFAIALFALGKTSVIKNTSRAYNYALFCGVLTLIALWIAFYAQVRLVFGKMFPAVLALDSRWWISWGIIVLLVAYLIISLIFTAFKIRKIEKHGINK